VVRLQADRGCDKFRIDGVDLAPAAKTIEWCRKIVEFRAQATVEAIQRPIAQSDRPGR
jgi:hypothetical protein